MRKSMENFSFPKPHLPIKLKLSDYTDKIFLFAMWKTRRKDASPSSATNENASNQTGTKNSPLISYLSDEYTVIVSNVPGAHLEILCCTPDGVNAFEWIASNAISFSTNINSLYGTVRDFCTPSSCPVLTGYSNSACNFWIDDRGKKTKCTALQYLDLAMEYVDKTLNDDAIFPRRLDTAYTSTVDVYLKKIMRYLLQILCHIYHAHFSNIVALHVYPHLNSVFLHFIMFNTKHKLIEPKDTEVLNGLYDVLCKRWIIKSS